mmetsp:Transcript_62531/g.86406  ORF Transcript_62531/g.86406 Transcript_62531/m.86406 type:complete len:83 (+) Transcript_62531:66-314(+)
MDCCPNGIKLVITDLNLSILDGFAVTKKMKIVYDNYISFAKPGPNLKLKCPIIGVSAHITQEIQNYAKASGIDKVISKPRDK